jgi:hypothetical protein
MAIGLVLVPFRSPEFWPHPGLYAEDGVIFFQEQMIYGWRHLFYPYNGYIHLIPRLAALAFAILPVAWNPMAYGVANVFIQTAAASFFFLPENRFLVRSDMLRLVTCLLMMSGLQADDLMHNVVSVQWPLFPVALLILGQVAFGEKPLSRARAICYAGIMALICLTVPLLVFMLPFALWFSVRLHGSARLPALAMVLFTSVQALIFRFSLNKDATELPDPNLRVLLFLRSFVATAGGWIYRVVLMVIVGDARARAIAAWGGEALAIVLSISLCGFAYWYSQRFSPKRKWLFRWMILTSVGLIAMSLIIRNLLKFFPDFENFTFFAAARYFLVPEWLFFVAVAMVIDERDKLLGGWRGVGVMVLLFWFGVMGTFRVEPMPDMRWAENAPRIEDWRYKYSHGLPRTNVVVPIFPPGWAVNLPGN